jgi:hypothetical protein
MQQELDEENPELGIRILGINKLGAETGVEAFDALQHSLPMVNDMSLAMGTDEEGSELYGGQIWQEWGQHCQELEHEEWNEHWRDVYILDGQNSVAAVYNLTVNSLSTEENYMELKSMLISLAAGDSGEGQE